jgi:serine protease Do
VALQLLQFGRVRRGHLGIVAKTVVVPQRLRRHVELADRTAVRVMSTSADGPARQAGLEAGDLLLRFDDAAIAGIDDLHRALDAGRIGRRIPVQVWRMGRMISSSVTPVEPPG